MIRPTQPPDCLARYVAGVAFYGDVRADMVALLTAHSQTHVVGHCMRVAADAHRLAIHYGLDVEAAEVAGRLHDISAIVPNDEHVVLAEELGLDVLPEERAVPMIVHQKLSASIAELILASTIRRSSARLAATPRSKLAPLDTGVFVADKIRWDQAGVPPYLETILAAVDRSLADAAFCYLDYLWQRRDALLVVHPWLVEALQQLAAAVRRSTIV